LAFGLIGIARCSTNGKLVADSFPTWYEDSRIACSAHARAREDRHAHFELVHPARQQRQKQPVIQIEDLQEGEGEEFLPLNGRKVDCDESTFRLNFRQAKGFPWKLKSGATSTLHHKHI